MYNYLITGQCDQLPPHKLFTDSHGEQYLVLCDRLIICKVIMNDNVFYGFCQCVNKSYCEAVLDSFCCLSFSIIVEAKPFSLGNVFITPKALTVFNEQKEKALSFLERHASCDWGNVCIDRVALNNFATVNRGRIVSSYLYKFNEVWVVTESDRTFTTVLLSAES